jgi:hypothetical protein
MRSRTILAATTWVCLTGLTFVGCTTVNTTPLDGTFAAGAAAHAFQLASNRWPENKAELEEGAAAAGVKLRPGEIVLAPQPDGRLLVWYKASSYAGNPIVGLRTTDSMGLYLAPGSNDVQVTSD